MIALIYGTDTVKRQATREAFIVRATKQFPGAELTTIHAVDSSGAFVEESISATNLFGSHRIVVLISPILSEEVSSVLPNIISGAGVRQDLTLLIVEEKLLKEPLTRYQKFIKDITVCDISKTKEATPKRNPFVLSDAVVARDKKLTWKRYREAIDSGSAEEEIAGMLFWALKTLALAANCEDVKESGLHPFVYQKAKAGLRMWPTNDINLALGSLVSALHDSRVRSLDVEVALEQFILRYI